MRIQGISAPVLTGDEGAPRIGFFWGAINIVTGQVLLGIGQLALLKIDGAFVTG